MSYLLNILWNFEHLTEEGVDLMKRLREVEVI